MGGRSDTERHADRLREAERRLAAIAKLASSAVAPGGTAEANLVDAEARLTQIYEIALRDDR